MKRAEDDGIKAFVERLKPQLRLFYRAAHAITASRSLAERTLSNAMLSAYLHRSEWRERMSFREGVLRAIREAGIDQTQREPEADVDWKGIQIGTDEIHPLIGLLAAESQETQRDMILRYGCSMSLKEIAHLTAQTSEHIRDELTRCQARVERALKTQNITPKPFEHYVTQELRRWMNRENSEPIDEGYFLTTFERDARVAQQPRHIAAFILKSIFFLLAALLLGGSAWVMAVLMEMP